jgi:ABC-2 type transport system ATP-binding protein
VRILATLTRPDAGHARVAGCDIAGDQHRLRRRISLTGQFTGLDAQQTGAENLRMVARLSGLARRQARRRTAELLELFGLAEAAGRRVGTYSGGMRRRLDLAATLVTEPSVIFLDEPTTGLDLPSGLALWQVITELGGSGVTTVLTTQYLEEADRLADLIVVIDAGKVVAEGTPAELKQQVAGQRLELTLTSRAAFDDVARAAAWAGLLAADPGRLLVSVATDGSAANVRHLLDRNAASTLLVFGVALLIGFRPHASPLAWPAAAGILLLFVLAISSLAAVAGLLATSAEAASGFVFAVIFLPYPSSTFVPIQTMPTWLQGFARDQPVTPVVETLRGLLLGTPVGASPWHAVAWCGGILAGAAVLSGVLFRRRTA